MKSTDRSGTGPLRATALIGLWIGALGSVGFMLYAGRNNPSILLRVLFTIWVLSPFVMLTMAEMVSKRWRFVNRGALYVVMLAVAVGSLAIYGTVALRPPKAQGAFAFVVVPVISWVLIAIVLGIAGLVRGKADDSG